MVAITVVLITLIPLNIVNDRVWEFFDQSITFRVYTDYASEHLTLIHLTLIEISAVRTMRLSLVPIMQQAIPFCIMMKFMPVKLLAGVLIPLTGHMSLA
jgi:hypothetical protein